eukprot:3749153-Pyramimonas_sp.AAC.1
MALTTFSNSDNLGSTRSPQPRSRQETPQTASLDHRLHALVVLARPRRVQRVPARARRIGGVGVVALDNNGELGLAVSFGHGGRRHQEGQHGPDAGPVETDAGDLARLIVAQLQGVALGAVRRDEAGEGEVLAEALADGPWNRNGVTLNQEVLDGDQLFHMHEVEE